MPLFGGSSRPKLDGLTREEEKRRDSLNPEVLRRSGEQGVAGQGPSALAVLKEKVADEGDFIWRLLLGRQLISMHRFTAAIDAFNDAIERERTEVRGYYGAGLSYFQAAEAKLNLGDAVTDEMAPMDLTVDNLYQESLRCFRRATELTNEKSERDELGKASAAVEKALARKAGRL